MNAIEMNHVALNLEGFEIKPINLQIPKGHLTALIIRNGSGKTTLFKLLHVVYPHFEGTLKIRSHTYLENERDIRESIAVMYDSMYLNPKFSPTKLLNLVKVMNPHFNDSLFNEMVKELDLDLNKPIKNQSLGMKRKLDFAFTLSSNRKILLLDEPFNGIDPVYKKKMVTYIQTYLESEENTVLLSSHQVGDLEKIADYIMIIDEGKLIAFNDKETLLETSQKTSLNKTYSLEDLFVEMVGNTHE